LDGGLFVFYKKEYPIAMSKKSTFGNFGKESRRWWESGTKPRMEWACELFSEKQVGKHGIPPLHG
jgi:hypothetical protein